MHLLAKVQSICVLFPEVSLVYKTTKLQSCNNLQIYLI